MLFLFLNSACVSSSVQTNSVAEGEVLNFMPLPPECYDYRHHKLRLRAGLYSAGNSCSGECARLGLYAVSYMLSTDVVIFAILTRIREKKIPRLCVP